MILSLKKQVLYNRRIFPEFPYFQVDLIGFDMMKLNHNLIFDHIKWSFNIFKKVNLPQVTLRKIVKIQDTDASLEIRRGR